MRATSQSDVDQSEVELREHSTDSVRAAPPGSRVRMVPFFLWSRGGGVTILPAPHFSKDRMRVFSFSTQAPKTDMDSAGAGSGEQRGGMCASPHDDPQRPTGSGGVRG